MSANGNMCHFYTVLPSNKPFNFTMMCERSFLFHISFHNFSINFRDVIKTSSPRKPPQKTITTAETKKGISLILINTYLLHSVSHPSNKSFIISLVTPK